MGPAAAGGPRGGQGGIGAGRGAPWAGHAGPIHGCRCRSAPWGPQRPMREKQKGGGQHGAELPRAGSEAQLASCVGPAPAPVPPSLCPGRLSPKEPRIPSAPTPNIWQQGVGGGGRGGSGGQEGEFQRVQLQEATMAPQGPPPMGGPLDTPYSISPKSSWVPRGFPGGLGAAATPTFLQMRC